jgi:rhomboid protease GluP
MPLLLPLNQHKIMSSLTPARNFGPPPYPPDEQEQRLGEVPAPPPMLPPPPRPRAVYTLLALIVLLYLLTIMLSGSLTQPSLRALLLLGAKENSLIDAGQYWRLITATFLHGSLIHIFFNSFALYALGPESERIYGTARFLTLYFIAGLGGSVASYLMSPAPSVGASGAIFGLIGGLGVFSYLNRQVLGEAGRAQVQSMATIAVINLVIGFSAPGIIDNWGHMGGLVAGTLVGAALAPRFRLDPLLFPPVIVRRYPPWGWLAALGLAVALSLLAVLLPGA